VNSANAFAHLRHSSSTHTGRRRMKNEDSLLCMSEHGVFVVADGMGGAGGGDVASKATVDYLRDAFANTSELGLNEKISKFRIASDDASRWIKQRADRDHTRGMGSTVVGLVFDHLDPRRAVILHAGDSRVYMLRDQQLSKLMVDHSPAAEAGIDDESEVPFFMQGIITRAVGVRSTVKLELTYIDVKAGDYFLVCSDGLYNMLGDDEIVACLTSSDDGKSVVQKLVDDANQAGGLDNISVVLVENRPEDL